MAVKIFQKGSSEKLSANFKAREFDCKGAGCCSGTKIDEVLVAYLQQIRDKFKKPVYIQSGYRCVTHNAKVANAASKSKHMDGMAADIVVDGVEPLAVAQFAESIGVLGIGLYDDFVHIDTRKGKSFWYSHTQVYRESFLGYALKQFICDVQAAIGAKVDGIAGAETLSKTPTVSRWKNCKHPVVKAVQRRLNALGYTQVGEADGIAGRKFDAALKRFQREHGCVADGEITAGQKTWRCLLGMG
jgi:peptidoglycan hydrolase-like protein with peptidoglycan-binding domain